MFYVVKLKAREKQGYSYMREIVPYEVYFLNDQYSKELGGMSPMLTRCYAKIFRSADDAKCLWIESEQEIKKYYDVNQWEVIKIE